MRDFLQTNAGKGTACVCLAVLIIAVPPALTFLTAGVLIAFAVGNFRDAFRAVDAEIAGEPAGGYADYAPASGPDYDAVAEFDADGGIRLPIHL